MFCTLGGAGTRAAAGTGARAAPVELLDFTDVDEPAAAAVVRAGGRAATGRAATGRAATGLLGPAAVGREASRGAGVGATVDMDRTDLDVYGGIDLRAFSVLLPGRNSDRRLVRIKSERARRNHVPRLAMRRPVRARHWYEELRDVEKTDNDGHKVSMAISSRRRRLYSDRIGPSSSLTPNAAYVVVAEGPRAYVYMQCGAGRDSTVLKPGVRGCYAA